MTAWITKFSRFSRTSWVPRLSRLPRKPPVSLMSLYSSRSGWALFAHWPLRSLWSPDTWRSKVAVISGVTCCSTDTFTTSWSRESHDASGSLLSFGALYGGAVEVPWRTWETSMTFLSLWAHTTLRSVLSPGSLLSGPALASRGALFTWKTWYSFKALGPSQTFLTIGPWGASVSNRTWGPLTAPSPRKTWKSNFSSPAFKTLTWTTWVPSATFGAQITWRTTRPLGSLDS